jgi:hypothetical protein
MRINWEVFFGDSSSEEALCLFAAGYSTFKQFMEDCSYSKERKAIIKKLQHRGYVKAKRGAQQALRIRGWEGYKEDLKDYRDL